MLKKAKSDLEQARKQLEIAQRTGDWTRAGQLKYSDIPKLEEMLQAECVRLQLDDR